MKSLKQLSIIRTGRDISNSKSPLNKALSPSFSTKPTLKINMKQSLPQVFSDSASQQQSNPLPHKIQIVDISPMKKVEKAQHNRGKRSSDVVPLTQSKRASYFTDNELVDTQMNGLLQQQQNQMGRRSSDYNLTQKYDNQDKSRQLQENQTNMRGKNQKPSSNQLQSAIEFDNFVQKQQYLTPINKNIVQAMNNPKDGRYRLSLKNSPVKDKEIDWNDNKIFTSEQNLYNNNKNDVQMGSSGGNGANKISLHSLDAQTSSHELNNLNSQDQLQIKNINSQPFFSTHSKLIGGGGGKQRILSLRLKVDSPSMTQLGFGQQGSFTANLKSLVSQFSSPAKLNQKGLSSQNHFLSLNDQRQTKFHQHFFAKKVIEPLNTDMNSPQENKKYNDNFITNFNFKANEGELNEQTTKTKREGSRFTKENDIKKDSEYVKDMMRNSREFNKQKENECLPGSKNIDDEFRFIHKNIEKIEEKNTFFGQQSSFLVDLVSNMNKNSLPPKKMNYLKENKNCSVLNINNFQLSSRQTDFLSKVINTEPYKNNLTVITANNNRITDADVSNLLISLPPKIEILSLKQNNISNLGIIQISTKLQSNYCSLIQVDLENNKIRDLGAKQLFKALQQNNSLAKLNLSQNLIGDICAPELKELIENTMTLQELYLKWNNLRTEGGMSLAIGLKKNQSLRVLDMSFNNFGNALMKRTGTNNSDKDQQNTIGKCLSEALIQNKKLIHLDMSYCNISDSDCLLIQEGLSKNYTIFGFHIEGNSNFFTDENGVIVRDERISPEEEELGENDLTPNGRPSAFTHAIQGVQHTVNVSKKKYKDNCWICEGWEYLQFNYDDNNNSENKVLGNLFIHFDFDGYKPHPMNKITNQSYQIHKMCPPNRSIQYFITEPSQMQIILDDLSNKIHLKKPINVSFSYDQHIKNSDEHEGHISLEVNKFNVIQTIQQNLFNQDYYQQTDCQIRSVELY